MILLYNVYLQYDRSGHKSVYYRGLYEHKDKSLDVFKYSLMSVKDLYPWSKIIGEVFQDNIILDKIKNSYNLIE